ncbi:MAG: ATP-dependent DNA helicase [Desulfuromonadales bacterium]|nr:ATP-dependent DNA helicase [Desulfuromonadales bacterium]
MKLVTVPLRDFAVPAPRSGSIDAHSGYGRAAAEGREIHSRVQKKRLKTDAAYRAEVPVSCLFEREGFGFRIDGRMDGIFLNDPPTIEEIKSGFNLRELSRHLAGKPLDHPYCLQLQSYGYFHWREHQVFPRLCFHLVSSRNGASEELVLPFDILRYEQWLEMRLQELVTEARLAEKRAARRRKAAAQLCFPFPCPRAGQIELMGTIAEGMKERRPMLIQAPTGLGKTVGVLYPVLKEALGRGQNLVYVTPKNSQHAVGEDAVSRFQQTGANIASLTITAKAKICFKDEPLCNPDYCEFARDYYAKIHTHGIPAILLRKRRLKARTFLDLGERYQVCPFELQLEAVRNADMVICDYNYVFAPRSALGSMVGMELDMVGKPALVIDEAHNLPARAMEYYSPSLSTHLLEKMRGDVESVAPFFRREALELLGGCLRAITSCGRAGCSRPIRINPPVELFLVQDERLRSFLSRYLDSDVEIGPQDAVLRLCFYWSEFSRALEFAADPDRDEFFTTFQPHPDGATVKITCCDASAMLRDCYADFGQVVAFSATLKPFDYYAQLSGLDPGTVKTAEFVSPFPRALRKLLIIPQVSTRYSRRERNYVRIAEAVQRIVALRKGNYFVFLPSFEFLDRVAALFQPPDGFMVLKQERNMKSSQVDAVLEQLHSRSVATIVFAVQGGSFSEGVDYAGDMVVGAFVIGPPLPVFDFEREQIRAYYQARYGAGFEYAYVIPAMAKAVQAAGRVIRSETDRGLIVLMDSRFLEPGYSCAMPVDWFETDVKELVSESILRDVSDFWNASLKTEQRTVLSV